MRYTVRMLLSSILALSLLIPQEPAQQVRPVVQQMLDQIAATPLRQHRGIHQSLEEMLDVVETHGRLAELGITRAEGRMLMEAAFDKLGLPHQPQERAAEAYNGQLAVTNYQIPFPVRAGTEFEDLEGVLFRWPYDWAGARQSIGEMVDGCADAGVRAYVVVNNASNRNAAQSFLTGLGTNLNQVTFLIEPSNSVWMRDYGPQFVYEVGTTNQGIIDLAYYSNRALDDNIPIRVGQLAGMPTLPTGFYNEGGNLGFDGLGTALMTTRIYTKNPQLSNQELADFFEDKFGVTKSLVTGELAGEGTGHVDMFAKWLGERKIVVGQYSPTQTRYQTLEDAATLIAGTTDAQGNAITVLRLPQPDVYHILFIFPVFRTYTNSMIIDNTVLVPTYNIAQDSQALQFYQTQFPTHTIRGINCIQLIESGGAIHCVTMEHPNPANGG